MANKTYRRRQVTVLVLVLISLVVVAINTLSHYEPGPVTVEPPAVSESSEPLAATELEKLEVKPWQTKSDYKREEFGSGWGKWLTCDTRQKILARDLIDVKYDESGCKVLSGILNDPYTSEVVNFVRGTATSGAVQIDHVVALSNAWKTGASYWEKPQRVAFMNDDLELLAVDGPANQQKSNADASEWLPANAAFRCQYVARQIAVKVKYLLWVTQAEYNAMKNVLNTCPAQRLPAP